MEINKITTLIGKKFKEQKIIAKSCTVTRSNEQLSHILIEVRCGDWEVWFTYFDQFGEFHSEFKEGNQDTLPPKYFRAMRRKAIREMKRAEPSLGIEIAQWING